MVDDSNLNLRLGPTIVDVDNGQHVPGQISSISTSLTTFKSSISIFKRKRVLPLARLELVFDAMLVTLSFHLDDDDDEDDYDDDDDDDDDEVDDEDDVYDAADEEIGTFMLVKTRQLPTK